MKNDGKPAPPLPVEEQLRVNVLDIMEFRRIKQADLAERLGRSQAWVSKRLKGKQPDGKGSRFQLQDLDALADIFGLSPAELLAPTQQGWDQRTGVDRRAGYERRRVVRVMRAEPMANFRMHLTDGGPPKRLPPGNDPHSES